MSFSYIEWKIKEKYLITCLISYYIILKEGMGDGVMGIVYV